MVRLKVGICLAATGALLLAVAACDPMATQGIYRPPFIPVTFGVDLHGHLSISAGGQITTPIGTFGIDFQLPQAVLGKAKDGTLVIIKHERDGQWIKDVYALHEKEASACLNGKFVMSADGDDEIDLKAEPGSVVRIVSAANADQACSSPSSGTTPLTAGLVVRLNEPVPGELVPLQGSPVSGMVTGDLGDHTLWLFKYAPGAGKHFLNGPLSVENGRLDAETGQVGHDSQDVGHRFTIELVLADSSAAALIQAKQPDAAGDVAFDVLPPGAKVVRAVTVVRK